jgi:hypothetical protein
MDYRKRQCLVSVMPFACEKPHLLAREGDQAAPIERRRQSASGGASKGRRARRVLSRGDIGFRTTLLEFEGRNEGY